MSKNDKQPSFSFCNKKFFGMFGRQILFKLFYTIKRGKQYKCVINKMSIEDRLEIMRAIFKPFIFKTVPKNVSQSWTQWTPHNQTINLFIKFILKHKKTFFGGYVKQITKDILRDSKGILVIVILSIQVSMVMSSEIHLD